MIILIGVCLINICIAVNLFVLYGKSKDTIRELHERCDYMTRRIDELIEQERRFIESIWPTKNSYTNMETNMVDYLKDKYLSNEEDDIDNLYM